MTARRRSAVANSSPAGFSTRHSRRLTARPLEPFTWAWFNHASTDALSPDEAKEVDADVARFEKLAGQPFSSTPPQRELQCMRPNVDNTFDLASHKPLLVYLLTELVVGTLMQRRLMSKLGFTRHTIGEGSASIAYWHRPAPSDAPPSNDAPPLILLHGIGISWRVGYPNLLQELVDTAGQDRGIIAPESPVVALTAPRTTAPTRQRASKRYGLCWRHMATVPVMAARVAVIYWRILTAH